MVGYVEGTRLIKDGLDRKGRKLLFLALSGSHAWGLERPDSDLDLRGIYLENPLTLMSINKPRDTDEMPQLKVEHPDLDTQIYELEKFLRMLIDHNGNMVTLLNLPQLAVDNSIPWGELGKNFTTRKLTKYYAGYADSQRKRALSQRGGKALIYTYREMFEGLYLMKYGAMCFDFTELWKQAEQNGWYTKGLLYKYYPLCRNSQEPQSVTPQEWEQFYSEWAELVEKMDLVSQSSPLPEDYDGYDLCNKILQEERIKSLKRSLQ